MDHLGYLLAGWGISLAVIGVYAQRVLARGRKLSRLVPEDRRRWIDVND
ncbi:MAG: hypothetical protein KDB21_12730 [Acidimicrobiales bacterium]|nr:hypothetical protein [Acidimicrobiales bacterium]